MAKKKNTSKVRKKAANEQLFTPKVLDKTVIAIPLLEMMEKCDDDEPLDVIIELNMTYSGGRENALKYIVALVEQLRSDTKSESINEDKSRHALQYLFGRMRASTIRALVRQDKDNAQAHPTTGSKAGVIHRIWPDFKIKARINKSISTVKADAARNAFGTMGEGIVWAVMDSGIDADHPHFRLRKNLALADPLKHCDFTEDHKGDDQDSSNKALSDHYGHGTHVAGIIAGEVIAGEVAIGGTTAEEMNTAEIARNDRVIFKISAKVRFRDEKGETLEDELTENQIPRITGMAPRCKLVSFKVLDENGEGQASSLIAAIARIQEINSYGRQVQIHGVNMSVGYDFEPKWFACGQSPLCVEVNRLVKSGVVVVVAAGNTGYGWNQTEARGTVSAGMALTINDPGNAEHAITVGSTHRDMPHIYGVSYFSSKGPTGDGRMKPDLVAPGEKIISCKARPPEKDASEQSTPKKSAPEQSPKNENGKQVILAEYQEDSGTSMAAPHVSGVIAAFLSVRREFIGQAEEVKRIFMKSATDLNRAPYFQGRGLVDLMRAIQSV